MSLNTYMCEFCGEDFEVDRDEVIEADDIDGRGLTVYFCSEEHKRRYENGEDPI